MKRRVTFAVAAAALLAACDQEQPTTSEMDWRDQVRIENGVVHTPSGAVFGVEEWKGFADRSAWLVSAEEAARETLERQAERLRAPAEVQASVTGNPAPTVLCHTNAYICGQIPYLLPGAQIVYWSSAQWTSATVSDFQQFDAIYLHDAASGVPALVQSKNVWGSATTGRVALTGVHYEHCSAGWDPNSGPCRVLKASLAWIHDGTGTGLLMATQYLSNGAQIMPTVAPYSGVTYARLGGGWDLVRITDPGHATMQGSTDASLSNFSQSSHSIFGQVGGFTNVAEICDVYARYPGSCPGTFRPHFLVTSVGVADQDGDGVPDATDNCPTVGNADQADANGNGVGDACESAPTVTISPAAVSVAPGGSVTFTTTASDADHALSQLTYEWRVGGIVQPGATGPSFTASFAADATVRVTVRDPGLLSGFAEAEVTIQSNQPPTADAGGSYGGDEGASIAFAGSGTDPDGDALSYSWSFSDGGTATGASVGHAFDEDGSYTATLTVSDGTLTAVSTATVTVANVAPTAAFGHPASVNEGSGFTLTLTGPFDPSSADAAAGFAYALDCGNGTTGTAASLSCATSDDATLSVSGSIADDDGGATAYGGTVTVLNVAPAVDAGAGATLYSGGAFGLAASFGDPGADSPWSWSIDWGNGTTSGTTTATGAMSGSRQYLAAGAYTVTVTVTDKDGASHSDAAQVTVLRLPVSIDVKPGSSQNPVNLKANGVIPVAILSGPTANGAFDATAIDWSTLRFGPGAATEAHGRTHVEDVDGDGDMDVVVHFGTRDAAIGCGDTAAALVGATGSGVEFTGSDVVRTICK